VTEDSILPQDIPSEFQALLSACRVFLGTEDPSMLRERLEEGLDLDRLLRLANRHGVMPLLYQSVNAHCPQAVPQEWLAKLRRQYMVNAARNMWMAGELLQVLDLLRGAGILALPLKGPALAQEAYGDIALRQFSDLDVMVAPEDVERALTILQPRGYRCQHQLSEPKRRALMKTAHHHHLLNEQLGITLELHWAIAPSYYGLKTDTAQILNRAVPAVLLGREISEICATDTLMLLCQHGTKHTWEKLSSICDVAALIRRGGIDWPEEWEKSEANIRALNLGLMLADELLDVRIPGNFSQVKKDGALVDFALTSMRRLTSDYKENDALRNNKVDRSILYMRIYRYPWQRALFFIHMISDPAEVDMGAIGLPNAMNPVYRAIRPFRLIQTYRNDFGGYLKRAKGE